MSKVDTHTDAVDGFFARAKDAARRADQAQAIDRAVGMTSKVSEELLQQRVFTTQEAAGFLMVSRPFVIEQIGAGRLKCIRVNRHRRIEYSELQRYRAEQEKRSEEALQKLTTMSEELGMKF